MDIKYFSFGVLLILAAIGAFIYMKTQKAAAIANGDTSSNYANLWGMIIIGAIAGVLLIIGAFA